jgi:hypothetical protein
VLFRPRLSAVACFVALIVTTGKLRADASAPVQVRWVASLACPRGDFDRELARTLGDAPPSATAEVDVSELASGPRRFELSLQLTAAGHASQRRLDLATCADVRRAAALLIATALENVEHAAGPSWGVTLGGVGDLLSTPAITGGPELGLTAYLGALRLQLDARYLFARAVGDDDSRLSADIGLLAGGLTAAYMAPVGSFAIGPSLGVELGFLRGSGQGEQARDEGTLWASALLGGRFELPLRDWIGLTSALQLSLPVRRPSFSLAGEPPFYETRPVGVRLCFGVSFFFGAKQTLGAGQ